jgi:SAM-dependent methyltransferase
MADDRYAFSNAWEMADRRLELLELEHDPSTTRRLRDLGVRAGARCLEVGAGRGSIARWLSEAVGPSGRVVAADMDARLLRGIPAGNLEVFEQDVVASPLPSGQFDLVHARLLLMHLPGRNALLTRLVEKVRPGGAILCEEHDVFPIVAVAEGRYLEAWMCFVRAMEAAGVAPTWIRTVPARLAALGLADVSADVDVPFFRGGSREARFWQLTWLQSLERMAAEGVPRLLIEDAIRLLDDTTQWFHGPAMVGVSGRRR